MNVFINIVCFFTVTQYYQNWLWYLLERECFPHSYFNSSSESFILNSKRFTTDFWYQLKSLNFQNFFIYLCFRLHLFGIDEKLNSGFYFTGLYSFSTSLSTISSYQSYRWTKWVTTWINVDIYFRWNIIHRRDNLPKRPGKTYYRIVRLLDVFTCTWVLNLLFLKRNWFCRITSFHDHMRFYF